MGELDDFESELGDLDRFEKEMAAPKDWRTANKGTYRREGIEAPAPAPTVETSKLESLLRGGAQGATLGFADELRGALDSITPDPKNPRFEVLPNAERYRAGRDAYRERDRAAELSNPKTFGATELAGGVATAPIGGAVKSVGTAARSGGILGALFGLGTSEADLTQGDVAGAAKDTAKGAAIGTVAGPAGYGLAKGAQKVAQKVGDVTFNLRSLFGGEPKVRPERALDALGVRPGSAPNEAMQRTLDQKVVPPEDFPPSVFNKASDGAPDAMARVGKHPRVQVAQNEGVMAAKRGLGALEEQPWNDSPDVVSALVDMRRGIIPKSSGSMGLVGDAIAQSLKGARRLAGLDENLARSISSPEVKAELAQIIAAGREPNLSADAVKALAARGLTLLGVDDEP